MKDILSRSMIAFEEYGGKCKRKQGNCDWKLEERGLLLPRNRKFNDAVACGHMGNGSNEVCSIAQE